MLSTIARDLRCTPFSRSCAPPGWKPFSTPMPTPTTGQLRCAHRLIIPDTACPSVSGYCIEVDKMAKMMDLSTKAENPNGIVFVCMVLLK